MTSAPRRLFVTTALPYANGSFHIGHIMEYIQADVWVRFQRMRGHEVHFVGADDAHGAPIMLKAESLGMTPQELRRRDCSRTACQSERVSYPIRPLALNGYARERRTLPGNLPGLTRRGIDRCAGD